MNSEKGHAANVAQDLLNSTKEEYATLTSQERKVLPSICFAVAAVLACQELEKSKTLDCLPDPDALLKRMRARESDFLLLVGLCATFMKGMVGPNDSAF